MIFKVPSNPYSTVILFHDSMFFFIGDTVVFILACPLHRHCTQIAFSCTEIGMFFSSLHTHLQQYGSNNQWGQSNNLSSPEAFFL